MGALDSCRLIRVLDNGGFGFVCFCGKATVFHSPSGLSRHSMLGVVINCNEVELVVVVVCGIMGVDDGVVNVQWRATCPKWPQRVHSRFSSS